jgi:hypothetical protein
MTRFGGDDMGRNVLLSCSIGTDGTGCVRIPPVQIVRQRFA